MLVFSYFLYALLVFTVVIATDSEVIDEVSKFKEILQIENYLAVLFTEECCRCTECVEAEVLLGGMSKELEENLGVSVVRLKKPDLRSRYGVKTVPSLIYIRNNKTATYDGKFDLDLLYSWLQENREALTVDLDDETFEHLTQAASGATTGDWLVIFHDGTCCKNKELLYLENAGIKLRNKVNVATVNTKKSPELTKRFKINTCPSIIFFRHQKMYRFSLPDVTANTLRRFAEGFYKNSKAENVPLPLSVFDKFTEKVIEKTKYFYANYWYSMLGCVAFITVFTTFLLVCAIFTSGPRRKTE